MNEKNSKKLRYTSIVALVAGKKLAAFCMPLPIGIIDQHSEQIWHTIGSFPALGYKPPAGQSGIQWVDFIANPANATTYDYNTTDNITYADNDNFYKDMAHSTNFDIVVRARFNTTHAYCSGNTTWVLAWTKCEIFSSGLNIDGVECNRTQITTTDDYMWVNFYIQTNSTSQNLQLSRDQTCLIEYINLSAYY